MRSTVRMGDQKSVVCVGGEGGAVAEKSERSHDAHDCANLRVARCALVQSSMGVVRTQAFFRVAPVGWAIVF
jgi:hypothetical protein